MSLVLRGIVESQSVQTLSHACLDLGALPGGEADAAGFVDPSREAFEDGLGEIGLSQQQGQRDLPGSRDGRLAVILEPALHGR